MITFVTSGFCWCVLQHIWQVAPVTQGAVARVSWANDPQNATTHFAIFELYFFTAQNNVRLTAAAAAACCGFALLLEANPPNSMSHEYMGNSIDVGAYYIFL